MFPGAVGKRDGLYDIPVYVFVLYHTCLKSGYPLCRYRMVLLLRANGVPTLFTVCCCSSPVEELVSQKQFSVPKTGVLYYVSHPPSWNGFFRVNDLFLFVETE